MWCSRQADSNSVCLTPWSYIAEFLINNFFSLWVLRCFSLVPLALLFQFQPFCHRLPIAFIKNKIPMAKRSIVCSYTKEGRALIHTELNLNQYVLKGLREKISVGHSTEYHDSKISLFSAQKGKCAISGEEFADAEHVAVWLKVPGSLGGFERYKNMVLIHKKYLILLQELPQAAIKDLIKTLNITKKMLVKINSLREQANLSAII